MECAMCGKAVSKPKRGPTRRTCSARCRMRLSRQRAAAPTPVFPREMLNTPRWVRAAGKRPIMPSGAPASSTDPSTWSTYAAAQGGAGDGMGFMLGDGFGCIDLDGCLDADGAVSHVARVVLEANPGAFVEKSVSGRGLHVFGLLPEGAGRRLPGGVEVYSRARFIRTTGDVFQEGTLVPLNW